MNKKFEQQNLSALVSRKTVSVETITHSFNIIRIYLTDEGVNGTDTHLDQLEAILDASSDDVIEVYCLGCGGGSADSIIMLLNALAETSAHTVTILEGHNASAASMPMMVTDETRVGMYSSVMFHNIAGGIFGQMTNTAEAAKFYESHYNKFFADLYDMFLTADELAMIRQGRELYMGAEEIQERLEKRKEMLQAEEEGCDDPACPCHEEEEFSTEELVAEEQQ